jgi:hypothetical protein
MRMWTRINRDFTAFHNGQDLYNRHKGTAVWIAGSDPSLTGYPDTFLDDKIGITLHLAHVKFPRSTYRYASEYDRCRFLLLKYEEYRSQPLIAALPMYGVTKKATMGLLKDNTDVYFHRMLNYMPTGVRGEVNAEFSQYKIGQTQKNATQYWGGHGSCLHPCIYMAVLMGASEINLIGCGHGMYGGGLEHFGAVESTHHAMRPGYKSFDDPKDSVPIIDQTCALRDGCRKLGVGFNWYREYSDPLNCLIAIDPVWYAQRREQARRRFKMSHRIYWVLLKRPYYRFMSRM